MREKEEWSFFFPCFVDRGVWILIGNVNVPKLYGGGYSILPILIGFGISTQAAIERERWRKRWRVTREMVRRRRWRRASRTDDDDASSGAALAHLSELIRSAEARGEVIAHRLIRCPPLGALDVLLRW